MIKSFLPTLFSYTPPNINGLFQHINSKVQVSFLNINLISSCCEAKDSKKSKLNYCTSQEHNREKTRNDVSVLDVGGKSQRNILRKTRTVRLGLKSQSTQCPGMIRTRVFEVKVNIKERYYYANPTTDLNLSCKFPEKLFYI